MTPDRIIDQWEQDQDLLREVLCQFGHEAVSDKQPNSGTSTAKDPHEWRDATGNLLLASFYSENGVLQLHLPGCQAEVARAFNALRASKREMH